MAHNSISQIDNIIDSSTSDIPIPDTLISRRPDALDYDHDQPSGMTETHAPITDAPYSPLTGFATNGRYSEVQTLSGLMTKSPAHDAGTEK